MPAEKARLRAIAGLKTLVENQTIELVRMSKRLEARVRVQEDEIRERRDQELLENSREDWK